MKVIDFFCVANDIFYIDTFYIEDTRRYCHYSTKWIGERKWCVLPTIKEESECLIYLMSKKFSIILHPLVKKLDKKKRRQC